MKLKSALSLARTINKIGLKKYIEYKIKAVSRHNFGNDEILVRRGTPDLGVALTSLNEEFSCLKYLLPKDFKGLIIDGGGYIGTAAIALHKIYPKARIITIEPSSENYNILIQNIAKYSQITPIKAAISCESGGKLTLRNRGTGTWGFTVIKKPQDNPDSSSIEHVDTISIEDIYKMSDCNEIGIIKLDIEGAEKELFQKNAFQLNKSKAIIAELHDRIEDGCTSSFFKFSRERTVIKVDGEKFLSVKT